MFDVKMEMHAQATLIFVVSFSLFVLFYLFLSFYDTRLLKVTEHERLSSPFKRSILFLHVPVSRRRLHGNIVILFWTFLVPGLL